MTILVCSILKEPSRNYKKLKINNNKRYLIYIKLSPSNPSVLKYSVSHPQPVFSRKSLTGCLLNIS